MAKKLGEDLEYSKGKKRDWKQVLTDVVREVGAGLMFGTHDEASAFLMSLGSDKSYGEIKEIIDKDRATFQQENPVAAMGWQMLGSVGSAPLTMAKTLTGTAAKSTAGGGLYAGAESDFDPATTLTGAMLSGVISPLTFVPPFKGVPQDPMAQPLKKMGIPLTIGQQSGVRSGMGQFEEAYAQTMPFVGSIVQRAREQAKVQFNRATIDEALRPLGVKAPEGLEGNALYAWANKTLNNAYDEALSPMKLQGTQVGGELSTIYNNNLKGLTVSREYKDPAAIEMSKIIEDLKNFGGSGSDIKRILSEIDMKTVQYKADPNVNSQKVGDAFEQFGDDIVALLARNNPDSAQALRNADRAFKRYLPIRTTVQKVGVQSETFGAETFTPSQLLSSITTGDKTAQGRALLEMDSPVQQIAKAAQATIGSKPVGSQTAQRLSAKELLESAALIGAPTGLLATGDPAGMVAGALPYAYGLSYLAPETSARVVSGAGQALRGLPFATSVQAAPYVQQSLLADQ
jgi:hypothetical protein